MRIRGQVKVLLQFRLLNAQLQEAPWPDDPYALPGTPLGRCEREGRLVAAWLPPTASVPMASISAVMSIRMSSCQWAENRANPSPVIRYRRTPSSAFFDFWQLVKIHT